MLPKHSTLIHPTLAHKFSTSLTHNPKTHFSTFAPSSRTSPQNPIGHLLQKCIALLQCCASSKSKLQQIHAFSIRHGVPLSNPDMGKHLIFSIVSLSAPVSYAHQIFTQIKNPNVFTWNTMIRGYAECQNPVPVIQLYHQMHQSSVQPDTHTYPFLLKAVAKLMDVGEGEKIHSVVVRNGFESLVFVKNALLHLYACCGHVESAHKVFESMSERDLVAWNSVINGFALNGRPNEALTIFRDMSLEGVEPDGFTMVSLLSACAEIGTFVVRKRYSTVSE